MARTVVIVAHPHLAQSRVSARLMRRAARAGAGADVDVRDLYALYPDYWIDRAAEQAALAAAGLVVWLYPVHWYGMPPLMKLWLDEVFAFGWAYGPGGRALAGKSLWLVTSTGGPVDSYQPEGSNRHVFSAFLPPLAQTAALTGMCWRDPLVLHGAHRADEGVLRDFEEDFAAQLARHAAEALPPVPGIDVATDERPA